MVSRIYCVRVLYRRAGLFRKMSTAAQPQTEVDFLKGAPHKKHPGLTNLKTLQLPEKLQMAACSVILRAEVPRLPERVRSLTNFLRNRKRSVEDATLRKKAVELENEFWKMEMEKGRDTDQEEMEARVRRKVFSELKRTTYRWTSLKYNEEMGVVYMAARLAGGYAAVRRALNEIKKKDPSFTPRSLLDFGSGLGTVAWASHSHWPDSLQEMVCVDSSGPMNILAEQLLKGDDPKAPPHIKHVYFRQFLPVSPKIQFDLVVSAFTLMEIASEKEREEVVFTLWRKTSSYLVLVENGTKEGHQILMQARDSLLKKQEKVVHDSRRASVFAPCPHELTCPKLTQNMIFPCNFQQMYQPLPLPKAFLPHNERETEKFSYLILTRGGRAETDGVTWSRLVAPVLRRSRHVHCHTCSPDGQMHHLVVTASKHSRDVYRCARNSDWGDQLPVVQSDKDVHSDSD